MGDSERDPRGQADSSRTRLLNESAIKLPPWSSTASPVGSSSMPLASPGPV